MPERLAYSPGEAALALGVSRAHIYNLMSAGVLPSFTIGRARRIWHDDLMALGRVAADAA